MNLWNHKFYEEFKPVTEKRFLNGESYNHLIQDIITELKNSWKLYFANCYLMILP